MSKISVSLGIRLSLANMFTAVIIHSLCSCQRPSKASIFLGCCYHFQTALNRNIDPIPWQELKPPKPTGHRSLAFFISIRIYVLSPLPSESTPPYSATFVHTRNYFIFQKRSLFDNPMRTLILTNDGIAYRPWHYPQKITFLICLVFHLALDSTCLQPSESIAVSLVVTSFSQTLNPFDSDAHVVP